MTFINKLNSRSYQFLLKRPILFSLLNTFLVNSVAIIMYYSNLKGEPQKILIPTIFAIIAGLFYGYTILNGRNILKEKNNYLNLLNTLDILKESKLRHFTDYITEKKEGYQLSNNYIPNRLILPDKHLGNILDQMHTSLSFNFEIPKNNIELGFCVNFDTNNDKKDEGWNWNYTNKVSKYHSLKDLIENKNSTLYKIVNGEKHYFVKNKVKGIRNGEYTPSEYDKHHNNIGSIFCKEISIGQDVKYVRAIICINSFGSTFDYNRNNQSVNKNIHTILPSYEQQISLELARLYIFHKMESNDHPLSTE